MTRRARTRPLQRVNQGLGRMAPGGRKSAAESPVRGLYRQVGSAGIEVDEPEPEPAPGFLWPMDDTSSPFTEATGGPNLVRLVGGSDASIVYAVSPIAPDSTAAAQFGFGASRGLSGGVLPPVDDWITFDLWFSGVTATIAPADSGAGSDGITFRAGDISTSIFITMNYTPTPTLMFYGQPESLFGSTAFLTRTSFGGTVHLQIGIHIGSAVVIRWNESTIYTVSGAVTWDPDDKFTFNFGHLGNDSYPVTWDQIHVYAGPPVGM